MKFTLTYVRKEPGSRDYSMVEQGLIAEFDTGETTWEDANKKVQSFVDTMLIEKLKRLGVDVDGGAEAEKPPTQEKSAASQKKPPGPEKPKVPEPPKQDSSLGEAYVPEFEKWPWKTFQYKEPCQLGEAGWMFSNAPGAEALRRMLTEREKVTVKSGDMVYEVTLSAGEGKFIQRKKVVLEEKKS